MSPGSILFDLRTFGRGPLLHSLPKFNGLDGQLVGNVERQFLMFRGKQTVEEVLNLLQPRYWTTPHVGFQIKVCHLRHLRSRYAALTFKPTKIYLDTNEFLRLRPRAINGLTVTLDAS
ncbi:unnamed protein product [Hymenolepis diminuta]|uniref:Uncharacterized protein n=1 Tax=Hymenolepis diminuta TaxID=6216 RepID=A0A564YA56_HYMDI|nr:unnamed protein product [Hymenolepis diminuta]